MCKITSERAATKAAIPGLAAHPERPLRGDMGADNVQVARASQSDEQRQFPGVATTLSGTLSTVPDPHLTARDSKNIGPLPGNF